VARAYRMTSARRAAIKKAQAASARKRRGKKKRRIAAGVGAGVGALGVIGVTLYAANNRSRRKKSGSTTAKAVSSSPVNVVQQTTGSSPKPITFDKSFDDSDIGDIDYSGPGKITVISERQEEAKRKAARTQRKKNRVFAVDSSGTARSYRRYRPNDALRKRQNYDPKARAKRYEEAKNRKNPPPWLSKQKKKGQ